MRAPSPVVVPDSARLPPPSPGVTGSSGVDARGGGRGGLAATSVQLFVHIPCGVDITDVGVRADDDAAAAVADADAVEAFDRLPPPPATGSPLTDRTARRNGIRNIYVVFKGLSTSTSSRVCYSSSSAPSSSSSSPSSAAANPDLQFVHEAAVRLDNNTVDKMRNNFAVVEGQS